MEPDGASPGFCLPPELADGDRRGMAFPICQRCVLQQCPWTSPANQGPPWSLPPPMAASRLPVLANPFRTDSSSPGPHLGHHQRPDRFQRAVAGSGRTVSLRAAVDFMVQRQLPGAPPRGGLRGSKVPICRPATRKPTRSPTSSCRWATPADKVSNPFYGKVPASAGILAQPTVSQGQLLRPFRSTERQQPANMAGDSSYHSLQMKLEKRFGLAALCWARTPSRTDEQHDTLTAWLETTTALGAEQ